MSPAAALVTVIVCLPFVKWIASRYLLHRKRWISALLAISAIIYLIWAFQVSYVVVTNVGSIFYDYNGDRRLLIGLDVKLLVFLVLSFVPIVALDATMIRSGRMGVVGEANPEQRRDHRIAAWAAILFSNAVTAAGPVLLAHAIW